MWSSQKMPTEVSDPPPLKFGHDGASTCVHAAPGGLHACVARVRLRGRSVRESRGAVHDDHRSGERRFRFFVSCIIATQPLGRGHELWRRLVLGASTLESELASARLSAATVGLTGVCGHGCPHRGGPFRLFRLTTRIRNGAGKDSQNATLDAARTIDSGEE